MSNNDRRFYVYVLFRPSGEPCYVGKGHGKRMHKHETSGRSCNIHLGRIIATAGGSVPKAKIKDNLTEQEALALERSIIRSIGRKNLGYGPLVNLTDGGDGVVGWVPSQETRDRIRASNTGKVLSVETRSKMSAVAKGRPKSKEWKEKIGAAHRGKPKSEEARAKMREASAKRWQRQEERDKIKNWHRAMTLEEKAERKSMISRATTAAMTAEVRLKISASRRGL